MSLVKKINVSIIVIFIILLTILTIINSLSITINQDFVRLESYHELMSMINVRRVRLKEYLSMNELDSLLEERKLARELSVIRYSDNFFFNHSKLNSMIEELAEREEALVALHEEFLRVNRDSEKYYKRGAELKSALIADIERRKDFDSLRRYNETLMREHEALEMFRDNGHIELWFEATNGLKIEMSGGSGAETTELYYENSLKIAEAIRREMKFNARAEGGYNNYIELIDKIESRVADIENELLNKVTRTTELMHRISIFILIVFLAGMFINRGFIHKNVIIPLAELDRSLTMLADKGEAEPLKADYGEEFDKLLLSFNRLARKLKERFSHAVNREEERYAALEQSNIELRKIDLFKTNLIRTITTDLKGPLVAILDQTKGREDDNIYSFALKLQVNIERLLEIVKINTGNLEPSLKTNYIDLFLTNLLASYRELFKKINLDVNFSTSKEKKIILYSDYDKLEQILDNILYYIIKLDSFEENNRLDIRLINSKSSITIEFILDDLDFPEGEVIKILAAMGDLKNSFVDFSYELDLGILYVNELVNYMGGNFLVGNVSHNRGLKMAVTINKVETKEKDALIEPSAFIEGSSKSRDLPSILRMELSGIELIKHLGPAESSDSSNPENIKEASILVVDDDHYILLLIDEYLKSAGYNNVHTVKNGREAMEVVEATRVDLILCDVSMPFMNGRELLDRIIQSDRFKNIPVIFISALIERGLVLELKKKGAVDYITKPFEEDELLVSVENHLKKYYNFQKTVKMTVHDELTGLYNKKAIYSKLSEELSKREYNDLSLIFCDIDHFKEFNDIYGHQLGDRVLTHVGELIKEALRKYDFAGRYGGEEFVIVLANSDENQAINVAYKIRERLRELPLEHEGSSLEVRLSYGVACLKSNSLYLAKQLKIEKIEDIFGQELPFEAEELEGVKERLSKLLLKISDNALYSAKRTSCLSCGYRSEKPVDFREGSCAECGSKELEQGRDRVMVFRNGTIVPGVIN